MEQVFSLGANRETGKEEMNSHEHNGTRKTIHTYQGPLPDFPPLFSHASLSSLQRLPLLPFSLAQEFHQS